MVRCFGDDPEQVAAALAGIISVDERQSWSKGTTADLAIEAFEVTRTRAYGLLPAPGADGVYALASEYIDAVAPDVAAQLSRVGVRLAYILNKSLSNY